MSILRAIGLMSGTSLDGVDVALIETDGEGISRFGPTGYRPYAEAERAILRRALVQATELTDRTERPGVLAEADDLVTRAHADTVERFLREKGVFVGDIAIIGFHGQTVLHRPQAKLTVQIGNGKMLARRIGCPVAYDFRAADVAAGGQGAPLVPVFHRALAARLDRPRPIAILNIGGVANVTFIDGGDGDPVACDTGPGNALIDDFMRARTGHPLDDGGAMAAKGKADEAFIARILGHPFFALPPPKSLDRNTFSAANIGLAGYSADDGAATLSALTANAVGLVVPLLPRPPATWIVSGGGARNKTLVGMLARRLAPAVVEVADAVGWSADALEAQAFAYLAVRALKQLPITFPTTTGAPRPMSGGVVVDAGGHSMPPAP